MENFFEHEIRAREVADSRVQPEQQNLKPGDFCIRHAHGITIYSEILDPVALTLNGRTLEDLNEEEREEYECTYKKTQYPVKCSKEG
jgi:hypothetical protein